MNNFMGIIFGILLTIIIGTTVFAGDHDSVKSSMASVMVKTNMQIEELVD